MRQLGISAVVQKLEILGTNVQDQLKLPGQIEAKNYQEECRYRHRLSVTDTDCL